MSRGCGDPLWSWEPILVEGTEGQFATKFNSLPHSALAPLLLQFGREENTASGNSL
jgi:hypothetical protein